MKKIWQKSLASMVSAALCLTAFVGCLTVNAATDYTGTITSEGVAVATTATEAKLDVAVSVSIPNGTPGIAYTGLKATTEFGTLKGVEIKSGDVKVEELSTDGVTSIPAIDENGSFIIAAKDTSVGVNNYVLTLTFAKKEGLELVDGAKYPVTITYLGSQEVGAANWNEDSIGFNVTVKDITVATPEEDYITYTSVVYDVATSKLTVGRAAPTQKLRDALSAGTANGNRKVQLVVNVDGTEFLFNVSITSGAGYFETSGFALPHFTQDVKIYVRVTSGASGEYVVNTNAVTVNLDSVMQSATGSAFADAYNTYCTAE